MAELGRRVVAVRAGERRRIMHGWDVCGVVDSGARFPVEEQEVGDEAAHQERDAGNRSADRDRRHPSVTRIGGGDRTS